MKPILSIALGLLAVGAAGSLARAAGPTVTYTLSINDNGAGQYSAGDFALYASDSTGDNTGMASYEADLTGATQINNVAPSTTYFKSGGSPPSQSAGFTLLQSPSGPPTSSNPITGSQNTTSTSGVVLVGGFGQTSGNLANDAPAGYTDLGGTNEAYNANLLLATGTYSGVSGTLLFTPGSGSDQANVFTTTPLSDTSVSAANIVLATQTLTAPSTPEPATLGLLAIGAVGLSSRRRRRA